MTAAPSPVDLLLVQHLGYPGLRQIGRSRETGAWISLWDERVQPQVGCDDGERWGVLCETHATALCVALLDTARGAVAYPTSFCDGCRDAVAAGVKLRAPMPEWLRVVLHEVRNLPNYRAMTTAGPTLVRAALKKRTR